MSQFIGIYDNILSPEVCQALIQAHQESTDVTEGRTGSGVNKKLKDSLDSALLHRQDNEVLRNHVIKAFTDGMMQYYKDHPSALVSAFTPTILQPDSGKQLTVSIENFCQANDFSIDQVAKALFRYTGFTIQRYEKQQGGYHYFHSEIYPQGELNEPLHRQLAILLYLNDVEEGGETEFFYQQTKAKPKAGSMVIFPAGFTHTHKGHIPISDHKYVVTAWLLFNRAEHLYGMPSEQ